MYAIIETGGKQYRVEEGSILDVELLTAQAGEEVGFDRVLAVKKDNRLEVGQPYLSNVLVRGKVLDQGKAKKIVVFKYKAKKNYRRKQGHRQPYSRILIEKIEV
ncbi:MAG: 50S ribosomal protein L21 [Bacillota bacterium]|nr:50S ribosomal protein L21 [Bacillota bacterium]MDW7683305.1 50S ribosomal protein L21 [Bacillota bacterium]